MKYAAKADSFKEVFNPATFLLRKALITASLSHPRTPSSESVVTQDLFSSPLELSLAEETGPPAISFESENIISARFMFVYEFKLVCSIYPEEPF